MAAKPSRPARTSSSEASPDVALRSLDNPLPHTLDDVREEMNYWVKRRDTEQSQSKDVTGILRRLSRLLAIQTGLLGNQPGSTPHPQDYETSSAEAVSSFSSPHASIPADPFPESSSSLSASADTGISPEDIEETLRPLSSYSYSSATLSILNVAERLAQTTGRSVISTSCLLFAFAETAGDQRDTSWLARNLLGSKESYREVFSKFARNPGFETRAGSPGGPLSNVSSHTIATVQYAAEIVSRVERNDVEISPRHLFAALLVTTPANISPRRAVPDAWLVFSQQEIDLAGVREKFFRFLGPYVTPENKEAWLDILRLPQGTEFLATAEDEALHAAPDQPVSSVNFNPAELFISGTPGYTSEFCGIGGNSAVTDNLDVDSLARTLAELIVLRETRLPLAVGLFGNWGSGKSHFMNLMDLHMKSLAKEAPATSTPGSEKWCSQIVPIYFNAWHYSDSNLWASLVTEIFDRLFAHLQPRKSEFALLQDQLKEAGGVTTLAREEVRKAQAEVHVATVALENAQDQRATAKQELQSILSGFGATLADIDSKEARKRIAELLGVPEEEATFAKLAEKRRELTSIGGKARELWFRATAREGMAVRFAWLFGAMIALVLLRVVLPRFGPRIKDEIEKMKPVAQALFVLLSAAIGWLTPALGKVKQLLNQLEIWQKKSEDARNNNPRIVALQKAIAVAESNATVAHAALSTAEAREKQLSSALNQLRPERQLSNFIEGRAKSADYRDQLGLVSLARRDFQALSDIFTDAETLSAKKKQSPEDAEGLEKLSHSIDRVVLFIDDLDRCQPEKVVDVLQAVHLLLAYPLFAVVVGVDQRCLKQSLRIRFQGLLTTREKHDTGETSSLADRDEPAATPLDYLEKIFHIPFHLPPMTPDGFEHLIQDLTKPPAKPELSDPESLKADRTRDPSLNPDQPTAGSAAMATAAVPESAAPASPLKPSMPEPQPSLAGAPRSVPTIGSVPLHPWERQALQQYSALIQTPRGAKRFLNTYRLVRAGVTEKEWDAFRELTGGPQEFRLAMLFLAAAAGQPSAARDWFSRVRALEPMKDLYIPKPGDNPAAFKEFCDRYKLICTDSAAHFTSALRDRWLSRVERFTF